MNSKVGNYCSQSCSNIKFSKQNNNKYINSENKRARRHSVSNERTSARLNAHGDTNVTRSRHASFDTIVEVSQLKNRIESNEKANKTTIPNPNPETVSLFTEEVSLADVKCRLFAEEIKEQMIKDPEEVTVMVQQGS